MINNKIPLSNLIFWEKTPEEIAEIIGIEFLEQVQWLTKDVEKNIASYLDNIPPYSLDNSLIDPLRKILLLSNQLFIGPLCVTDDEIINYETRIKIENYLDPKISEVFSHYRDLRSKNDLQKCEDEREHTLTAMSQEEFKKYYGIPPWEQLSSLLEKFNLPYIVSSPSFDISTSITLRFKDKKSGIEIDVSSLSSGEQVLLRFALSLFQYNSFQANVILPKLLLLDEMDASLHPEMVRNWLNVIQKYLVKEQHSHVILTTHSPTTLALVPEDSIYEIKRNDAPPKKISKQEALNHLTVGVPTLAIDYSGRRHVFVESDTDVCVYQQLYDLMKGQWNYSRSLSFSSTGIKNEQNIEQHTGCDIVKKVVGVLRDAGNQSIFGILDWDGKNEPSESIKIIGHNEYYTLENILLEPALVGILGVVRKIDKLKDIDLSVTDLMSVSEEKLQQVSDKVVNDILKPEQLSEEKELCVLGERFKIEVNKAYRSIKGHDLEDILLKTYPNLKNIKELQNGKRGSFSEVIIKWVLKDYSQFCPKALQDVMKDILAS